MSIKKPILGIILPCYNEQEILETTSKQLSILMQDLKDRGVICLSSFIVLVNDGSKDKTWDIISKLSEINKHIIGIKLSRNFGHQNALLAGLKYSSTKSDCSITIDADLQDDIHVIEDMVNAFNQGNHIVYGVRKERKTDKFFKKQTAQYFYKVMKMLGVEIIYNHADYRLASSEVIKHLFRFEEVNLFLRGIFPLIGFKQKSVYYNRLERTAGETKYPLNKMIAFALEGITSFSIKPLRVVTQLGLLTFIISIILALYSLYSYLFLETVPGWTSITLPIYFISGVQLLCMGILGEYIGKLYKETKKRPRYIIEETRDN
ncbi:glycosyltransferase family 2 protein [Tamlana sp. 2201CG12-4]|uniref:glycosyltransferase family 2 protein n=1 Tax=Tamlana sp. 2201CG12-4 TaxID=3112582 RepID=UPI002DB947FD|nr:glycosyltransferase family 2 protein [Tamlana sp. 2201CG12-4]MEC3908038.1 glycosyltransferase family 2 protein [Tamlana sp. 2201CG12-4]